ncbi:TrkA family potassium uptake protein [Candidatus Babeliales bacterium]|nr:TrkA family potassium uptake protein [Candidatus Babeliales bacterium]
MKFCVIGLGRFGHQLAISLADQGAEVLAIDSDEELIEGIRDDVTQAICTRITDEDSLLEVGVSEVDTVIVATGENFEQSVLITALLKKRLKLPHVIARAINAIHEEILILVGADKVILPERDMGVRLADKLSLPLVEMTPIAGQFSVTIIQAPDSFAHRAISELRICKSGRVACIAVKKGDDFLLIKQDYLILENDMLVFAGDRESLASLARW